MSIFFLSFFGYSNKSLWLKFKLNIIKLKYLFILLNQ